MNAYDANMRTMLYAFAIAVYSNARIVNLEPKREARKKEAKITVAWYARKCNNNLNSRHAKDFERSPDLAHNTFCTNPHTTPQLAHSLNSDNTEFYAFGFLLGHFALYLPIRT